MTRTLRPLAGYSTALWVTSSSRFGLVVVAGYVAVVAHAVVAGMAVRG